MGCAKGTNWRLSVQVYLAFLIPETHENPVLDVRVHVRLHKAIYDELDYGSFAMMRQSVQVSKHVT